MAREGPFLGPEELTGLSIIIAGLAGVKELVARRAVPAGGGPVLRRPRALFPPARPRRYVITVAHRYA